MQPLIVFRPALTDGAVCPLAGFVEQRAVTAQAVVGNDFLVVRRVQVEKVSQPVQRLEFRLPYGNFPVTVIRILAN